MNHSPVFVKPWRDFHTLAGRIYRALPISSLSITPDFCITLGLMILQLVDLWMQHRGLHQVLYGHFGICHVSNAGIIESVIAPHVPS